VIRSLTGDEVGVLPQSLVQRTARLLRLEVLEQLREPAVRTQLLRPT
jgi:hypothetical protein